MRNRRQLRLADEIRSIQRRAAARDERVVTADGDQRGEIHAFDVLDERPELLVGRVGARRNAGDIEEALDEPVHALYRRIDEAQRLVDIGVDGFRLRCAVRADPQI